MKSYTTLRNLYGSLTSNTETANLTLGDQLINDGIRILLGSSRDWDFLDDSITDTTVADQNNYDKPYNSDKITAITVTVGSNIYSVKEAPSRQFWNELNFSTYSSSYPEYFFVFEKEILFWPTPSESSNTISIYYKKRVKDLANADYTTGTVTLTNDDETVTGSATTFTAAMVGRWLKGDNDGEWYEIQTYNSATSIELRNKWQGTTSAGLSYTIGEMPVLPEAYHNLPVYHAVSQYCYQQKDQITAQQYERMFESGKLRMIEDHGSRTNSAVIDDGNDEDLINPNLTINL